LQKRVAARAFRSKTAVNPDAIQARIGRQAAENDEIGRAMLPAFQLAILTGSCSDANAADSLARLLTAYAANAVGVNHVDFVANVLNTRQIPHGLLDQLLEIERRQAARQKKRSATVLNPKPGKPAAKMGVPFKVVECQRSDVRSFAGTGEWQFRYYRLHTIPPAKYSRQYCSIPGNLGG
jgi:hypothetical protein